MSGVIEGGLRFYIVLALLLMLSPLLQAEGLRSPEAVAQAFVHAYRSADSDAIVALQFLADGGRGHERQAWLRQLSDLKIRAYRVDLILARDQWRSAGQPLMPQKKLVVLYDSLNQQRQREETYLIGQADGFYYLLPVHVGL